MIRVAVTGAKGRMGSTVVQAVTDAPDMEVVALFDAGDEITPQSVNGAQVAVDFSIPSVTESNVHALLDAGVDVVVGTTGWTEEPYAVATARGIAKARAEAGLGEMPDATETDELGSRGGRVDGIPVHAVRLRGLTASEEILLGNTGEQLVIRTDSFDRVSFMPGVLLGVRRVIGRTGLTIGLDQVMGL